MIAAKIPLVCIVTRTKDRPLLLERALQSIYAQTMTNFIHVIMNDGGDTQPVEALLKKFPNPAGSQRKVIHNTTSLGMDVASNKAIKSVDSTFIAVHDDDDTWHPDFLRVTTQYLEEHNGQGVWVPTDQVTEAIVGKTIRKISQVRWRPDIADINLYQLCLSNYAPPIAMLYRREVYKTIGYYDESLATSADWDFSLRFLLHYDIDFIRKPEPLAFYHLRPTATGNQGNSVISQRDVQQRSLNRMMNKYLRDDVRAGKLGIGYMMNSLHYQDGLDRVVRENIDTVYRKLIENDHRVDLLRAELAKHDAKKQTLDKVYSKAKRTVQKATGRERKTR